MRNAGCLNKSNYKWRVIEYHDAEKTEPIKMGIFRSIREVEENYEGLTTQRVSDFLREKSSGKKGKSKDIFSKIAIEKISIPCPIF